MAVDKRAFNKLGDADKAIVREVMKETYAKLNATNLVDNRGARDALINAGLESVAVDTAEYQEVRKVLMDSTAELGEEGLYTPDLFTQMLVYIEEFRSQQAASGDQAF